MKIHAVAMLSLAGLLAIASLAYAQPPGHGVGMARYDKATEITVNGSVDAVVLQAGRMGGRGMAMGGTHLTFKAADNTVYDVHVGPANWLAANKLEFAKGDRIEIVGSSIELDGQKALIAREITKGDHKTTLRDANGVPVWSGRGRRTQS